MPELGAEKDSVTVQGLQAQLDKKALFVLFKIRPFPYSTVQAVHYSFGREAAVQHGTCNI